MERPKILDYSYIGYSSGYRVNCTFGNTSRKHCCGINPYRGIAIWSKTETRKSVLILTKKIRFDLQHIFWDKKGLYTKIYYHESAFKIHDVGIVYFNVERKLEKGYTIRLAEDENARFFKLF